MQIDVTQILIDSFRQMANEIIDMVPVWLYIAIPVIGITMVIQRVVAFFVEQTEAAEPDNKYGVTPHQVDFDDLYGDDYNLETMINPYDKYGFERQARNDDDDYLEESEYYRAAYQRSAAWGEERSEAKAQVGYYNDLYDDDEEDEESPTYYGRTSYMWGGG
jgi:hypothetical protein